MVASLKFFLGKDEEKGSDDSGSDEEIDPRELMQANKFNKKTRKREKQLEKVKKIAKKNKKNRSNAPIFNFSALHLIHDPQGMSEKLFKQLEVTTKRFEVRLMILDVISRLIGLHELFLFNFYPYLQRFMQPHQREVTRILQFTAQASHELVPPDVLQPLLKTLANNFITERNSSDVMAIGLNATREICARCPLCMDEDLLQDLSQYKNYRDKSVSMAAQSLIRLFRNVRPHVLHKKDRGRPTEATTEIEVTGYGQVLAKDYVPGAEILLKEAKEEIEINSGSGSDDDGEWVDIDHSSGEEMVESDVDDEIVDDEGDNGKTSKNVETNEISDDDQKNCCVKILKVKKSKFEKLKEKKEMAQKVTLERILTDEDFKRIDMANAVKQVQSEKSGSKRNIEESIGDKSDLVKLGDIENIYKKRKHDKQTRIETVRRGQQNREKYGFKDGRLNEHCSRTNREKKKNKNFQMIKHKNRVKVKRSFKDKQIALRNHLLKLKGMK